MWFIFQGSIIFPERRRVRPAYSASESHHRGERKNTPAIEVGAARSASVPHLCCAKLTQQLLVGLLDALCRLFGLALRSVGGETQARMQGHCLLDSLYRARVAAHAAMSLRVLMQNKFPFVLVAL